MLSYSYIVFFFNLSRERGDTPWAETTHLRMAHDDPVIFTHALISLIRNVTQLESRTMLDVGPYSHMLTAH